MQPNGFFETAVNVGTINGTASGTASGLNTINSIVVTSGSTGAGYNFGVQAPGRIVGHGLRRSEQRSHVRYRRHDAGQRQRAVAQREQSARRLGGRDRANGNYSFTNLQPGTYTLKETPPSGAFATAANVGFDQRRARRHGNR